MKSPAFGYHDPGTVSEAVGLLATLPNARVLAGGQSLVPMLNMRVVLPDHLIDLNGVAEMSGVSIRDGLLVIGAMYALMAIPLRSYSQPLIVLLVVPFGVVGSVLGHIFHGLPVSIMSFFGILGVCGVVVNDTLVLVDEINDQMARGVPLREAVQRGGVERFRAIFLTQITTFFGLVPLIFDGTWLARAVPFLFSNGAQSTHAQFLTPVSVAMGYGSLFATVITLVLVPLCYVALEDIRRLLSGRSGSPSSLPAPSLHP